MAGRDTIKQFWAGVFFVLGVVLLGWVVFFIGMRNGITEARIPVLVVFDKVAGLLVGAPVRLSGVTVGQVDDISFIDQDMRGRGVMVRLSIYRKFESQVRRCSRVAVLTEGVLGARYVEITRIPGDPPLDISRPVLGEPLMDVYDLAVVLRQTAGSFSETTQGINAMMTEIKYISRKSKRLLDRIERRVVDGNLFKVF